MSEGKLSLTNVNDKLRSIENPLKSMISRSYQIEKEIKEGAKKPFGKVIRLFKGDNQSHGQPPITYIRKLLTLVTDPSLLNDPNYPDDIKSRAQLLLKNCYGNTVGSYTESNGIEIIRKHIAEYIQERDGGIPSYFENIYLCNGVTQGLRDVLTLFNPTTSVGLPLGMLTPVPQYQVYQTFILELGFHKIKYYLDEENGWSLNIDELEQSVSASCSTCLPRIIVAINPGNPTGQIWNYQHIVEIVKFAHKHSLFIIADEVYQHNVYGGEFHSFKKVLFEMGEPYCSSVEMVSFMSTSKGPVSECGVRGGYMEFVNVKREVLNIFETFLISRLSPNTLGQIVVDVIVKPPKPGDVSFDLYRKECTNIFNINKKKGEIIYEELNKLDGVTCNPIQGALYAFPQLKLPKRAYVEATKRGMPLDEFYARELLEQTGIFITTGTLFLQKEGTFHLRICTTIGMEQLTYILDTLKGFHQNFMNEYK